MTKFAMPSPTIELIAGHTRSPTMRFIEIYMALRVFRTIEKLISRTKTVHTETTTVVMVLPINTKVHTSLSYRTCLTELKVALIAAKQLLLYKDLSSSTIRLITPLWAPSLSLSGT